ncbi:cobyrinate a,c-diamide synthase [Thioalkalivibrio sp. ALE19]|uniref:cobyrinate a,c-diamide synthase n=1 Tax=Thioalkalivibrio sp. ALE19 TaxID=1266909 RepID=UPI0004220C5D|nr:cobyrinate a,c-diamide synthase [Thioalkalivibrio sp. ALE19]
MPHLLLAAAHKSSGKTTLATALCAALRARGLEIQPFKKGPDYIDPLWLGRAAGRPCVNLDFHTQESDEIVELAARYDQGADLGLVEANKGLFDGVDPEGHDCNAALARLLDVPVVLVIDCRGMTRGIAPLLLGYRSFDPQVRIAGVILNRVGGARHESKLRAAVERYTDLPVLGAVHEDPSLEIAERYLGLIPSNEVDGADAKIRGLATAVASQVDLDGLLRVARTDPSGGGPVCVPDSPRGAEHTGGPPVRIAVARDAAFGFYYPTDLDALEAAGAELCFFDTLHDRDLPPADALLIGGGFPESRLAALAANRSLREAIRTAIEAGTPAYAECGGLMYLSRSIRWGDQEHAMVGAIPATSVMHDRPQGRGYVSLRETREHPWPPVGDGAVGEAPVPAHEFHYSALEDVDPGLPFAWEMQRGCGVDGRHDGIVYRNLLASYSHQRHTRRNPWARRFVAFVRQCRRGCVQEPETVIAT